MCCCSSCRKLCCCRDSILYSLVTLYNWIVFVASCLLSIFIWVFINRAILLTQKEIIYEINDDIFGLRSLYHTEQLYQLVEDWQTVPFTEMKIINANETCPEGFEEAFYDDWMGTVPGCLILDRVALHTPKSCYKNSCSDPRKDYTEVGSGRIETRVKYDLKQYFNPKPEPFTYSSTK